MPNATCVCVRARAPFLCVGVFHAIQQRASGICSTPRARARPRNRQGREPATRFPLPPFSPSTQLQLQRSEVGEGGGEGRVVRLRGCLSEVCIHPCAFKRNCCASGRGEPRAGDDGDDGRFAREMYANMLRYTRIHTRSTRIRTLTRTRAHSLACICCSSTTIVYLTCQSSVRVSNLIPLKL